jgi:hypothetical protein
MQGAPAVQFGVSSGKVQFGVSSGKATNLNFMPAKKFKNVRLPELTPVEPRHGGRAACNPLRIVQLDSSGAENAKLVVVIRAAWTASFCSGRRLDQDRCHDVMMISFGTTDRWEHVVCDAILTMQTKVESAPA